MNGMGTTRRCKVGRRLEETQKQIMENHEFTGGRQNSFV